MGDIGGEQLSAVYRIELILVITEFTGNPYTAFVVNDGSDFV